MLCQMSNILKSLEPRVLFWVLWQVVVPDFPHFFVLKSKFKDTAFNGHPNKIVLAVLVFMSWFIRCLVKTLLKVISKEIKRYKIRRKIHDDIAILLSALVSS